MTTLADRTDQGGVEFTQARQRLKQWQRDPALFVRQELRATPDPWQLDVLADFVTRQRLALVACKGPGKTAVLSWIALNFLLTRPSPKIAITSITGENLRDNLWAELGKWGARSRLLRELFEFGKERISYKQEPDNWFISARRWARDSDSEQQEKTLAGLHAEHLLFMIDEAGGVPDAVASAAEGGLSTGRETKLVLAGNPTHLEGPLYRAATTQRRLWCVHQITADPDDPRRAPRVSKQWANEMAEQYGADSAWYQVNVLGRFPRAATEGLIPLGLIEDSFGGRTTDRWGRSLDKSPRIIGADCARYGPDWNRAAFREGDYLRRFEGWKGVDTIETAGRLRAYREEFEAEEIRVDDIGIGGGVVDQLAEWGEPVVPIHVGAAALDSEHYFNLRAELAGNLRDRFRDQRIALDDEIRETGFAQQASTIRTKFGDKGVMKLEPKDDFRKRTRTSPDCFDAVCLAFSDYGGPSIALLADGQDEETLQRARESRVLSPRGDRSDRRLGAGSMFSPLKERRIWRRR